ncbi:pentatricopeptide repeat-containing protein At5g03800-like [Mangifera indica]|uniref:pentatricopeptide repeat-containing protein At5g03800-like n=1 Tax=Mangifera indica TaxID=29780 RepID=UPI001CFA8616|nr:pentatricopeptide repeat-containing protein At5g03800-like [Mangifera indica]
MELENRNMANKNRDMNKNWREIFEDALWIAQKLGLPSANKLQERLRELGPPTTVQKQETSREAESKKDGSIEMGDFDRRASIPRDDEVIFGKIKVDLVETVHFDGGFAGSNKVRPLESTPMLNLHAFRSKEMKTSVGSVKKRKEKEAAGGKEKEKVGIKNPTRSPPNPETQPNPKALSHNSNPNQFQYTPNFSFHKSNPTQLSFFINHPINQTKIYDPGPSHKIFLSRTFFSPHFLPFSTSTSTATPQPLHSSLHHPPISSYPLNIHNSSSPNNFTTNIDLDVENFFTLLRLSVQYGDVSLAKVVHASIEKIQEEEHTCLGNPLISAYVKMGLAIDAYKVFTGLSNPNVMSFTSLVSGFVKSGREKEAIELFLRMRDEGIEPNEHSFVAILTACIRLLELNFGSQVHGLIVKMGYLDNVFVANALMGLYGKFSGLMEYVVKVFDEMSRRDIASWNTVISSMVKELKYEKAFELFCDMKRNDDFRVNYITISTLLTALTGSFRWMEGRSLRAHAIRIGIECNLSVNNGLIGFCTKCGSVKGVEAIFERMPIRDVITWTEMVIAYMEFGVVDSAVKTFDMMPEKNCILYNALLAGFCKNSRGMRAIDFFVKMVEEGLVLTDFTLTSVINACGSLAEVKLSKQIHGFVLKFGFGSNACIEATLLDMMTRCGRMADAEKMFHQWSSYQESSIIWTSMLCGYARNGQPEHAISLYHRSSGKLSNVVTTFVLTNCQKFFINRQNLLPFEIAQESSAAMKVKYPSFHLEDKVILVGRGIVRTSCNGRAQNQGTPQKQDKEEDTKARQQLDHYENADTWQIKSRVVRGERGIKIEEKKERGERLFSGKNRQLQLRRRAQPLECW